MYMMRRVHAEQSPHGGHMNAWVMQWQDADLNKLIKTARFNLDPFKEVPVGSMWEDHSPTRISCQDACGRAVWARISNLTTVWFTVSPTA